MARIDFTTKNIGKKIHDDGDYEIPEVVVSDPALGVPERFGLNIQESPPIVFDRFPGMSDSAVTAELDRQWNEEQWPHLCSEYLQAIYGVKMEANDRLEESKWRLDRALEEAKGDWSDPKVEAELAKRKEVRDNSNAREAEIKAALLARKDKEAWPDEKNWLSDLMTFSTHRTRHIGVGQASSSVPADYAAHHAKTEYGIENPGRKD